MSTYDADGRATSVTRRVDGTTTNDVKTTYAYTALADTTTAGGVACPSEPDSAGRTVVTDPRGKKTTYCWNQNGNVSRAFDPMGRATSTKWTPEGNASKFSSFAGGTSSFLSNMEMTYGGSSNQNVTQQKAPQGETTDLAYATPSGDPIADSRPSTVTDPQGKASAYQYNAAGDVTQISDSTTSPKLKATLTYNANGTIATSKDGANNTTTYAYNAKAELTTITPPGGSLLPPGSTAMGTTSYTYDGASRPLTMTDGRGKVTTYAYNKLGEVTSVTDHAAQVTTYGYDANGNRTNRTTGSQATTYVFDKLGRKTSETLPGSLTNTYGYDKAGNLTTLTDPTGTSTYAYDDLGRTSSVISPAATTGNDTVTYAYTDPAGGALESKVVQTLPGSGTITTVADLSGKTTSVTVKNAGGTQTLKRSWLYTRVATGAQEHDLVDTRAEFDGASTTADRLTVYAYDQAGELTDAQSATGAGANIRYDALTYDAAGNRTARVRTDGAAAPSTTTYAYNAQNQLCWRANVVVTTPVCNSGIPSGATQYTYDAAGNQLAGDQAATWDAKSRLASLAGASATFLTTNNSELTGLGTTSFHENVLGTSRITSGSDVSKIVRSTDDGSAISQVRAGVKQWFAPDNLGSTIALIDNAGGITRRYDYDIDGNDTTTGTGNDTWLRYAGGHLLPGTGSLYHFGARLYSPQSARWTQADPLLQPSDLGNANRYAYAGNNPANFVDPDGLSFWKSPFIRDVKKLGSGVVKAAKWGARRTPWGSAAYCAAGAGATVAGGGGVRAAVAGCALSVIGFRLSKTRLNDFN